MTAAAPRESRSTRRRDGLLLVALVYLGFVSIGLPDGLLGVAWPSIRATFGLRLDALGGLLVAYTAGYLASSFSSGKLLAVVNLGSLLALSCLATAASLIGFAAAPAWAIVVALGVLAGCGAGAIDAGLNTYAATEFSARGVSWLHAFYGVGATIGPFVMTSAIAMERGWRSGYAVVGAWQLALAAGFLATRRLWSSVPAESSAASSETAPQAVFGATLRLPAVWLSVATFAVYTGIEAAAGAWVYSLMTEMRSTPMATAGLGVSVYFGALTAGRFLGGFAAGAIPVDRLLRLCIAGMAGGAGLVTLDLSTGATIAGLALMGLAEAPVFPSLIAATPARLGAAHTRNAVGFQISGAVLGQSLIPAGIGLVAAASSLEAVGPSLFALSLALFALHVGARRLSAS